MEPTKLMSCTPVRFCPPLDSMMRRNMNMDYDTVLVLKSESHNLVLILGLSSPVVFQQVPFNLTAIMPSQTMSPSFLPPPSEATASPCPPSWQIGQPIILRYLSSDVVLKSAGVLPNRCLNHSASSPFHTIFGEEKGIHHASGWFIL